MQGNFSPFLYQPKLRTPNLAAVMTEEPQPKALMTWDVAVLPASMDAVLMVNRSCYCVPEKTFPFSPGNSTADGDNFMGCGDQELPEAPPEVPFNNKNGITLVTKPTRCVDCPRSVAPRETLW